MIDARNTTGFSGTTSTDDGVERWLFGAPVPRPTGIILILRRATSRTNARPCNGELRNHPHEHGSGKDPFFPLRGSRRPFT